VTTAHPEPATQTHEDDDNPRRRLAGYAAALASFGGTVVGSALLGGMSGKELPDHYGWSDLTLGAVATHKFARVVTKDAVMSPLRAPFTHYQEPAGSGEVNETAKHEHPEHTIGELLTCPFCMAPWIATAYVAGLAVAPRWARAWAATFALVGTSDALQHVYARLRTD
jgi:hypothetical protein